MLGETAGRVARGDTAEDRPELLGETLGEDRPELLGETLGKVRPELLGETLGEVRPELLGETVRGGQGQGKPGRIARTEVVLVPGVDWTPRRCLERANVDPPPFALSLGVTAEGSS